MVVVDLLAVGVDNTMKSGVSVQNDVLLALTRLRKWPGGELLGRPIEHHSPLLRG